MKFEWIRISDVPRDIWAVFDQIRASSARYDDPMFDPLFARLVADCRRDAWLGLALDGGELVGFWPLHRHGTDWARPIGGPFADCQAPVISERLDLAPAEFLAGLGLAGITMTGYTPRPGEPCRTDERTGAHLSVLDQGLDQFFTEQKRLYPKHDKKMRRLRRNLSRAHKTITVSYDDPDDAHLDRLIEIKQDQYRRTGRHDVLAAPWARTFVRKLRTARGPRFRAVLTTLCIDGRFAAGAFNLCSDRVVHGWITAYEREFAEFSPGLMLVDEILGGMPARGLTLYDAGPGLEHYKKYHCNAMRPLDTGVMLSGRQGHSTVRRLASSWRSVERAAPEPAARLMGKVRRRSDQILVSETGLADKVKGFASATRRRRG